MRDSALLRLLKRRLPPSDIEALASALEEKSLESYETAIKQAFRAASALEPTVTRNEEKAANHFEAEAPIRRLQMAADNSSSPMLMAIARKAFRESYARRFDNRPRSLQLAEIGLRATLLLRETGYLGSPHQIDLEAEAWVYLGNARRINSDIAGAEGAFEKAEAMLELGTGDRELKARLLHEKAALRFSQARGAEAAELYDREINLRRLLGEPQALGHALIDRGVVATWLEPLANVCELFGEGAELVNDPDYLLITLTLVSERLARDGDALVALKAIHRAETLSVLAESETHLLRLQWVRGIAYRALGQLGAAENELRVVRRQLAREGPRFRAGIASLDLAATFAAGGKTAEVKEIAEEAFTIFQAEGLDNRALAALLVFQKAALAEELTEALAVRVANFIVGYQYNRNLRFEPGSEA